MGEFVQKMLKKTYNKVKTLHNLCFHQDVNSLPIRSKDKHFILVDWKCRSFERKREVKKITII